MNIGLAERPTVYNSREAKLYSLCEDEDLVTVRDWNSLSLRSDGQSYLSKFPRGRMRRPRTEAGAHSCIPSAPDKRAVAVNQRAHHSSQLLLTWSVNEMNYLYEEEH